jgi:hypothetical protein
MGRVLSEGRAYARLAELTDSIGPRLAGSPAAAAAEKWALARFEEDLKGTGGRAWLEPVKVPHWERGTVARGGLLAQPGFRAQPFALLALGGSPATPPGGLEAEVVEVDSLEALQAAGERVRGKVVFFDHAMAQPSDYGRFSSLRTRGPAEAGRLGAVAALVRSLATASLRSPHTGATNAAEGAPPVPAAALSVEDAELLHRAVAAGPARVRLELDSRTLPDADGHNVVAEIRGREKPDEVVLLGAHLDSWDVGTGAHDDGAGVVMVMEALRVIAQQKPAPRRTVRVVLFANEENGLRGGRGYAEAHAAELPKHVAALEMDSGAGRPLGVAATAGGEALMRRLLPPLAKVGAGVFLPGDAGGADIGPMRPAGVPFVAVRVDPTHYFDVHHTEADTLDKVDPVFLAQDAAAVAWVAYALADAVEVLPRQPPPAAGGAAGRH